MAIIIPAGKTGKNGDIGRGTLGKGTWYDTELIRKTILSVFEQDKEPMSVRYLFYRCVTGELLIQVAKNQAEYSRISEQATNLRDEGLLDPALIYDGGREFNPTTHNELTSPWHEADEIPLIMTESESAAGMITPVIEEYQVGLTVARGQCSFTLKWEIAEWIKEQSKPIRIIYCGDFDKAGFNIPNEICDFLYNRCPDNEIKFTRVAITEELIRTLNLSRVIPKKIDPGFELTTELEALSKDQFRDLLETELNKILPEGALEKSNQMLFAEDFRNGLLIAWGKMVEHALMHGNPMPTEKEFRKLKNSYK